MNISEINKSFVWLQARTGSVHSVKVLKNYGFSTYKKTPDGLKVIPLNNNHSYDYPSGHQDYLFLSTARNPFSRILSFYKFNNKNPNIWSPQSFHNYFFMNFSKITLRCIIWPFRDRIPDYFIRIESLFDDYNKIPFIVNSDFDKLVQLRNLCSVKYNETDVINDVDKYFTEEIKDIIFSCSQDYCNMLNYDYPY